eukprot:CAMPEP_0202006970 /NCGR_PEP_ID=MMETSP0905-20130828/11578_1 /ASSEMBLY_ACC=CAM_ASM_000554 /TAXON_ID=420261 /ORGANISM="Thalassiosira antarctica, Strain CCMP982" /LENGTH=93 /DNA_ID=CAMNT_0048564831 /DNA_START=53 /DNA_END=330 /DNA_ORIENTATION=+
MVDASPPPDNASPQPDANYGDGGMLNSSVWSLFEPESASAPSVAPSTPKRRRLFILNDVNAPSITNDSPSNAPITDDSSPNAPMATAASSTTL